MEIVTTWQGALYFLSTVLTSHYFILLPVVLNTIWSNLSRPYIQGGSLTNIYDLCSMVFHWGQSNEEGSEHTLDYVRFPMELQVCHINREYNSPFDAITNKADDGMLIVSFFFQVCIYYTYLIHKFYLNSFIQSLLDRDWTT